MTPAAAARLLLRADALFEVGLGVVLLTAGRTGLHKAIHLPPPASLPVTRAFGAALVPLAALLWGESARPAPTRLRALAGVNAITAAVFTGWLARNGTRSTAAPGVLVLGSTSTALLGLAIAQARTAARLGYTDD